ncbi:transcription factor iws-1 [Diplogelasinospora grovesii]|uniref:Transcription factor iws-1 n=1 Tax=Diplogelasinospora grovesii TaxID=303347 RepID=A0AAN6NBF4_9PEZI|nr:transcription factor iws-1 [Diplogelasinospora grovesii]
MSDADSPAGSPVETTQHHEDDEIENNDQDGDNQSDKDSDLLSEIDEDQFDDYDPTTQDRPVEIDENVAKTLKPKRKRTEGETSRKPKEGRRPKKRARSEEDVGSREGTDSDRRPRKARAEGERRSARKEAVQQEEEDEPNLTPEERRRRALDRAIDAAVKNPAKRRRKKDEIDLEDQIDEQIAQLKVSMEKACVADNEAREKGQPAVHKLKLLPHVTGLLNRTAIQDSVLDPETNFLQSVKYFLEPLNDGSLPAYNIQRDIFTALAKMSIGKDALLSSGIGKVVLFYTRSKRPEIGIKRIAERLLGEWSRPILKRTDDYKKRHVETADFDYNAAKLAQRQEAAIPGSQLTLTQRPAGKTRYELERERMLAPEILPRSNRAQPAGLPATYTIAPKSTFDGTRGPDHRPIGSAGTEAFRKMTQKGKGGRR